MASTSPVRLDDELYASAKAAGSVMSRSAAQQVAHWARIGREVEASGAISYRDVARALAGAKDYDTLTPPEQALVRAGWAERLADQVVGLDLARSFAEEGRPGYVELDATGQVVRVEVSTRA